MNFRACVFTNLGRDHLDYHGTIENYFAAKLRLFTEILLPKSADADAVAVVNGDDPFGRRVLDSRCAGRKLSFGFGRDPRRSSGEFQRGHQRDSRDAVASLGKTFEIARRCSAKSICSIFSGPPLCRWPWASRRMRWRTGVRRCPGAPGRLEAVAGPAGVKVLVDYAHKPDALEAVLDALRALRPRRLICVFGCGGDRDRGKRPIMGEIAGRLADTRDSDFRQSAHRRSAGDYRGGRSGLMRAASASTRQAADAVTWSSPIGARRSRWRCGRGAATSS